MSDRFCDVKYSDSSTDTSAIVYTAYLPTAGQDEEFLEILFFLNDDIVEKNTDVSVS